MLPESFLPSLVAELKTPNVIGITLAGSFSRGQGGPYSDVDLQIYVRRMPRTPFGSLTLRQWQGHLVSIHCDRVKEERAKLTRPWDAIWAVPGLRQAVILYDTTGSLADLKQAAVEFNWPPLQALADQFASDEFMGFAEEAYKIVSGLKLGHESKVMYASLGLVLGMAKVIAVQHGILIETENRYFELVQNSVGQGSEWTHAFRLALGADIDPQQTAQFKTRGAAALSLYRQTVKLMNGIIQRKHRDFIINTLKLMEDAGY